MPELPDITIYIERLRALLSNQTLEGIRFANPFLLRSVDPPIQVINNQPVIDFERIGKQIVFVFPREHFLILHLMISGRLHWRLRRCGIPAKIGMAALDFTNGSLLITEAATTKRASLSLVQGRAHLSDFDLGGLDVFQATPDQFRARLLQDNHTLKRALTDPRLFSGIGNSYSDEILHRAQLSPVQLTQKMDDLQIVCLYETTRTVLAEWTERLRQEVGASFPEKVTAFHEGMAVHGRFGNPCPVCSTPVQRIRYATNETNYCPNCQTGGKLLADRALSRLLKKDWPRNLDEFDLRHPR